MFSMPVEVDTADSVLCPGSLFFEFLPIDANDDFSQVVTMDKVEVGKSYEFIITNFAGLYRYRMSDSVEIVGWYNQTPLVKFIGRVDKSVNISGEKIPESDIEHVVEKVSKAVAMPIFDFCVYPDYVEKRYRFLVEPLEYTSFIPRIFAEKLQEEMENNSEKYMVLTRAMKALQPLSVQRLQRYTCLLHTEIQEYKGASMNTIKPVHVITKEAQEKFFRAMVEGPVYTVSSEGKPEEAPKNADPAVLTISLKGRLDTGTAPQLDARFKTELDGVEKLIIDMKDLEYVSSAGLRVLLQAHRIMSARGGMTIINANGYILDVFEATGFNEIFTIE